MNARTVRATLTTALALAAAVTLAACGAEPMPTMEPPAAPPTASPAAPSAAATSPTPAATSAAAEPAPVPETWNWTAMDVVTGEAVEGASFAGKDVILWFWAPWCPICNADAPGVAAAQARLPEDVLLVGVPGQADAASSKQFVSDRDLGDFQHVYDPNGGLWDHYQVFSQPQFILVNDDGSSELVFAKLGEEGIVAAAEELAGR